MASPASLLPSCGVCEESQSCLIRLPCHEEHRLCRSCLATILTLPEPPCPWCRAVVDEDRCELLLFGPVACQECGETKGAEETAFCEACEAVFCLRCVSFKHPREHRIRPFQDSSLLRSSLAASLSATASAKAAFAAKLAAAAELLWREGATEAEALRDRLPGGLKNDGKRMEISEQRAAEMTRRYARLAGLEASTGDASHPPAGPPIRQLVLEESAEALAARIRKSFDPERRDEPQARPGAQEADVPGPSRLSAPSEASSGSATVAGSSAPSRAESAKKKKGRGAGLSPPARGLEGSSAPALLFRFQCIRCNHFDHHKDLCPYTTSQVDIMHREHRCRNCRRIGHWDHECRWVCQSCGAPDHRAANCPGQPCKFCHQDDHVANDCPQGRRRSQALSRP